MQIEADAWRKIAHLDRNATRNRVVKLRARLIHNDMELVYLKKNLIFHVVPLSFILIL